VKFSNCLLWFIYHDGGRHKVYENIKLKYQISSPLKCFLLAGTVAMVLFGNLAMFFLGIGVVYCASIFWRQAID
jgi:hypothetical protein